LNYPAHKEKKSDYFLYEKVTSNYSSDRDWEITARQAGLVVGMFAE
jgi:hypothetical protein